MTEVKGPDCLFPEEVERMIRSFRYIQKRNFNQHNGKCHEESAFQGIRDRCTAEITILTFILGKRRV